MTLALTAAEIDALAKKAEVPFDYLPFDYHLSSLFRKEADAQGLSPEKAEALRFIGRVLVFPFRANDPVHPFGDARTNGSFEALTVEQTAESARVAVAGYVASARALEDPQQWLECAQRVERAARLSRSLGQQDESFAAVSAYLLEIVDKHRGNDPLFLTGKAVELLLEFNIGNPETYLECISRAVSLLP
jgi:hypothetical protein